MTNKTQIIILFVGGILVCGLFFLAKNIGTRTQLRNIDDKKIMPPELAEKSEDITNGKDRSFTNADRIHSEQLISEKTAIEIAFKQASTRSTCDTNSAPRVEMINDHFEITFWSYENPFWNGTRIPDNVIRINSMSGISKGMQVGFGGTQIFINDPKTKPGNTLEEKEEYQSRMRNALLRLTDRVRQGQELNSPSIADMIEPTDALHKALEYMSTRDRSFSLKKNPTSILIDDIYLVVFWRDEELISDNSPTYDSRIGIDAHTGEIIGMEITRYQTREINSPSQ